MAGGAALAYHAGKNAEAADQNQSDQQPQYQQQAPAAAAPAAGGMAPDAMAKLQQLGQLHEQGILTDEEFAEQKKKILA